MDCPGAHSGSVRFPSEVDLEYSDERHSRKERTRVSMIEPGRSISALAENIFDSGSDRTPVSTPVSLSNRMKLDFKGTRIKMGQTQELT